MSEDFLQLPRADAAALCVGRVILAWGDLDFSIENLLKSTWGAVADRLAAEGKPPRTPPDDGRSTHRLKQLRRYLAEVSEHDEGALSAFDKLQGRAKELERFRSPLAHGRCVFSGEEHDAYVTAWYFTEKPAGDLRRTDDSLKISLAELSDIAENIHKLEREFASLLSGYYRNYIVRTLQIKAASAWGETRWLDGPRRAHTSARASVSTTALLSAFRGPKR